MCLGKHIDKSICVCICITCRIHIILQIHVLLHQRLFLNSSTFWRKTWQWSTVWDITGNYLCWCRVHITMVLNIKTCSSVNILLSIQMYSFHTLHNTTYCGLNIIFHILSHHSSKGGVVPSNICSSHINKVDEDPVRNKNKVYNLGIIYNSVCKLVSISTVHLHAVYSTPVSTCQVRCPGVYWAGRTVTWNTACFQRLQFSLYWLGSR